MSAPEPVVPGPYDLEPRGATTGDAVLCIHGLTGTPYEVRPLAEALADRGLRARGPLLAGHGGTPAGSLQYIEAKQVAHQFTGLWPHHLLSDLLRFRLRARKKGRSDQLATVH